MSNTNAAPILMMNEVRKSFKQGQQTLVVLDGANLTIHAGQVVALVGQSGSGKSTFLQIAGLLEKPDAGSIYIAGQEVSTLHDSARTEVRGQHIGVVYQYHHLLPDFSALENVVIPQLIKGVTKASATERAQQILASLGLEQRLHHRPAELSGGEQQRVAIARAMICKPSLILADEPTGNLDPSSSKQVFRLLVQTAKEHQIAVLFVTHNMELARECEEVHSLKEGKIE